MPRQKYHKITCIGHAVLIDDEGEIIEDMQTDPVTCRSLEDLGNFYTKMKADINEFNNSQPNRKQRRSTK